MTVTNAFESRAKVLKMIAREVGDCVVGSDGGVIPTVDVYRTNDFSYKVTTETSRQNRDTGYDLVLKANRKVKEEAWLARRKKLIEVYG